MIKLLTWLTSVSITQLAIQQHVSSFVLLQPLGGDPFIPKAEHGSQSICSLPSDTLFLCVLQDTVSANRAMSRTTVRHRDIVRAHSNFVVCKTKRLNRTKSTRLTALHRTPTHSFGHRLPLPIFHALLNKAKLTSVHFLVYFSELRDLL